jgi:hypothetical protein
MYQQDLDNKNAALKAIYGIDTNATTGTKSAATRGSIPIDYKNIAPGWTPS